jgi:hypothetical protein
MTGLTWRNDSFHSRGISRRDFLKLAAMAGLLAGCRHTQQTETAPTAVPTDSAPAVTPTVTPAVNIRRPDVIKMYPDAPSKVVHTRHTGGWDGDELASNALRQMLDASITELTGQNDASEAWAALFSPSERIAIKVNTINTSHLWTHVPLVMAVTDCLQEAGVPAEQIFVFDRDTDELADAGFPLNRDGPGVRCYGTDGNFTAGWAVLDLDAQISDILLHCDALINMPILKQHTLSGITFAMKNHYGTFDKPGYFHGERLVDGMAELNGLPPIRERTRLIIGDVLEIAKSGWKKAITGDSILMSFDPVAHDTIGLQLYSEAWTLEGGNPAISEKFAIPWLESGAALGLGANDLYNLELVNVNLE